MRKSRLKFPFGRGVGHWLYLIGFMDGRVKVGMTGNPRARFYQHMQQHRNAIEWVHLFSVMRQGGHYVRQCEARIVDGFAQIGSRLGATEVFHSIDKRTAIETSRRLIREYTNQCARHHSADDARRAETRRMNEAWVLFKKQYFTEGSPEVPTPSEKAA